MCFLHSGQVFGLNKATRSSTQQLLNGPCVEACPLQINIIPTLRVKSDQLSQALKPTTALVITVNFDQALFWFTRYFTYTLIALPHMILMTTP